jgi:hypothetical protein
LVALQTADTRYDVGRRIGDRARIGCLLEKLAHVRAKGITYDTGFYNEGTSTHEPCDAEVVKREMRIIHGDLQCSAVRVTGGDPTGWTLPGSMPRLPAWRSGSARSPAI